MAETPPEGAPAVEPTPTESMAAEAPPSGKPVLLYDRYNIDVRTPLPDFSTPSASAFHVEDRRDMGRKLFGLICTPGLPPRTNMAAVLRGNRVRGLLPLVEWDSVFWPPLGQRCMVMIYERPLGGKLASAFTSKEGGISEHDLPHRIVEPLVGALQEISTLGFPHRAVRPDNLFLVDEERQNVVLGDCLTTPPGFDQPTVFETVMRGMASPGGRGEGDISDDLYALGVTLVLLLLGQNPVGDMSEDDLINAKEERGTYATLCGNRNIPISLLEPLRGLLADSADERWGLREVDLWQNGRRLTPIPKRPVMKPETRFHFAGHEHLTLRTVARAFTQHVADAARVIKEGQLEAWLRRNMGKTEIADAVVAAVAKTKASEGSPLGSDDFLVAHVGALLDPEAPIRYKGVSFVPEGFGPTLAVELLRQGNTIVGGEILTYDIPGLWTQARGVSGLSDPSLTRDFARLRGYLQIKGPGYGIERCLYDLNPSFPCQSPLIIQDYVVDIGELLNSLDQAANRVDTKSPPMDRHIAAFIAASFDYDTDSNLRALGDSNEATRIVGLLSLLALIQWRQGPNALYGLSSWLGGLLQPAINAYHSRTLRRDMEREIPRLVRQGSLPDLFDYIDNAEKRRQDEEGFENAIADFADAEHEIQEIDSSDAARNESAERIGQQAAAMTSVIMTLIFVSVLLFIEIW